MTGSPAASRSWTEGGPPSRGFSMLEVLVAFVVLALVGTSLFRLFSGALANVAAADDYSRAVLVAESVLAEAAGTPPLREGTNAGSLDEGRIEWTARVTPYTAPQENPEVDRASELGPTRLWRITADVRFVGPDGKPRLVSLATLRLGAREGT